MDMIAVIGISQRFLRLVRTGLTTYGAERPTTTVVIIMSLCTAVLPFVTATALMPLTILLDLSNALSTKGLFYVLYSLFFQVTILAVIIFVLFIFAFMIASGATILHRFIIVSK